MARIPVAIVGASGYTGAELLRILLRHPAVRIAHVSAKRAAGQRVADVFPHLRGFDAVIEAFDPAVEAEVAFVCLPHGEAAPVVAALATHVRVVIDLSADYRLRDPAEWARWYGSAEHPQHPAPELLARAVYGMPERNREALRSAKVIAAPGCYPTAAILAIAPLVERGACAREGIVVDAKSGVSGAGRSPALATHLPEAAEGIRPYKVAGAHRHTAEIEQVVGAPVIFTPHLVPMSRGILSCAYLTGDGDPYTVLEETYAGEPFVDVLPRGALPDTAHVRGSNRAQVTAVYDPRARRVLAVSAIDNLVKGASGQAVQCMNLALGLEETVGLEQIALFP